MSRKSGTPGRPPPSSSRSEFTPSPCHTDARSPRRAADGVEVGHPVDDGGHAVDARSRSCCSGIRPRRTRTPPAHPWFRAAPITSHMSGSWPDMTTLRISGNEFATNPASGPSPRIALTHWPGLRDPAASPHRATSSPMDRPPWENPAHARMPDVKPPLANSPNDAERNDAEHRETHLQEGSVAAAVLPERSHERQDSDGEREQSDDRTADDEREHSENQARDGEHVERDVDEPVEIVFPAVLDPVVVGRADAVDGSVEGILPAVVVLVVGVARALPQRVGGILVALGFVSGVLGLASRPRPAPGWAARARPPSPTASPDTRPTASSPQGRSRPSETSPRPARIHSRGCTGPTPDVHAGGIAELLVDVARLLAKLLDRAPPPCRRRCPRAD